MNAAITRKIAAPSTEHSRTQPNSLRQPDQIENPLRTSKMRRNQNRIPELRIHRPKPTNEHAHDIAHIHSATPAPTPPSYPRPLFRHTRACRGYLAVTGAHPRRIS